MSLVWVIAMAATSVAQLPNHIGVGNTYTYTEKDGVDENNFFACGTASDGRAFLHANNGSLFIKGNNYTRKIKFPDHTRAIHIEAVFEISPNRFVAIGDAAYYVIQNDTLLRVCRYTEIPHERFKAGNNLIAQGRTGLYVFEKDSFVCKSTVPDPGTGVVRFYTDEKDSLWKVIHSGNELDFYKINASWNAEFQFTLNPNELAGFKGNISINKPVQLNLTGAGRWNNPNSAVPWYYDPAVASRFVISQPGFQYSVLSDQKRGDEGKVHVFYPDKLMGFNFCDSFTHSVYFGSFSRPFRCFTDVKKFPRIFNKAASSAIHAIAQDKKGRIWAGNYEGILSIIDKDKITEQREEGLLFLPGSLATEDHVYINSEQYKYGLVQFDMNANKKGMTPDLPGFYLLLTRDKQNFYYGASGSKGVWKTTLSSLERGAPVWNKIDSTKGNKLSSAVTITEDRSGRIWMCNPVRGIAVYYPDRDKTTTWLTAKGEIAFGCWSSLTDHKGTVWLGTGHHGLMYYNEYSTALVKPKQVLTIAHPLLKEGTRIMQLAQCGRWLVMGTEKDMLLMDLDEWYKTKKVLIRYLNPQEANFTAPPEQNTILVDKRDSSVWFATSDMLYQWDLKQWLSLPVYKVAPNVIWHRKEGDSALTENQLIKIKPVDNTLAFTVWFQSRDNMPRYMSVALVKKGGSLKFSPPSLQTKYDYPNLASGNYELAIQICQSDGTVSIHRYPVTIKKFWWQYWWVWLTGFTALFMPFALWLNSRRKAQLARAEIEMIKAEQQKKLSNMQVVSLSNQFRPHFILNALNTIGAELDNKPQAESVLSRLGESIDIIFKHAQQQEITHSFADEWKLVKNVIDIHRLMYLKKLETRLPRQETIDGFGFVQIPLGLIQIPVENALLHGLSNREAGPWRLEIDMEETTGTIKLSITDNGVGRAKAATLSNYRKHGTGTKNLDGILNIVNDGKADKITIQYEDDIYSEGTVTYGTRAIIVIPKNFRY